MKKKSLQHAGKMAALLTLGVVLLLALAGCGKPKTLTLEEKVKNDSELQKQIDQAAESSDTDVTVKDNTIYFKYTFEKDEVTEETKDTIKEYLVIAMEGYESTFTDLVKEAEDSSKIDGVKLNVQYLTADGEVLYEKEFSSK